MNFRIQDDIESVIEILDMTQTQLAAALGVSRVTVNNWISGKVQINEANMRSFYEYAFDQGVRLNRIKAQFYLEETAGHDVLLFHGAKTCIDGQVGLNYNKKINDFGNGFYCGESLEQSVMFVSAYPESSLYILRFTPEGLKPLRFEVNRDWMLMVAFHRGRLKDYENAELVKTLIEKVKDADYIIAPIADNRMFEIIDSFIDGEITDVQCQHCLSATDLGKQYVFTSQRALNHVTLLERCFLANAEKKHYLNSRQESFLVNQDKVKLARRQYRNQGNYIEDLLK